MVFPRAGILLFSRCFVWRNSWEQWRRKALSRQLACGWWWRAVPGKASRIISQNCIGMCGSCLAIWPRSLPSPSDTKKLAGKQRLSARSYNFSIVLQLQFAAIATFSSVFVLIMSCAIPRPPSASGCRSSRFSILFALFARSGRFKCHDRTIYNNNVSSQPLQVPRQTEK